MPDINLLQSEQHDVGADVGAIARIAARVVLAMLILAFIGYGIIYYMEYSARTNYAKVIEEVEARQAESLASKERNEVVTRQEQLEELETLIDNHLYWSYLMPELARVTLKSGRYTKIEAKNDGKLNLTVNLPSYEDIEKFMQIFDLPEYNQQFSNVRIVSINKTQTESTIETQLTVQLTFNPAFIKGRI